jgi:hypothetical protein
LKAKRKNRLRRFLAVSAAKTVLMRHRYRPFQEVLCRLNKYCHSARTLLFSKTVKGMSPTHVTFQHISGQDVSMSIATDIPPPPQNENPAIDPLKPQGLPLFSVILIGVGFLVTMLWIGSLAWLLLALFGAF